MYARTKKGVLRLVYEGREIMLTCEPVDLPDALAKSIATHVNVELVHAPSKAEAKASHAHETHRASETRTEIGKKPGGK